MGASSERRRRRRIDWQSVACGVRGHAYVGTDAARLRPEDELIARELGGVRWHRCLRCDTWVPWQPPPAPSTEHPPDREQIEIPLRGEALRAKIVLRLIAVDRAFHFVVLGLLGIAVLALQAHQRADRGKFERVLTDLQKAIGGGPIQTHGHVGFIGELDKVLTLRSHTLKELGFALLAYALLEGIEAVGLWLTRRWAEYLTFLATTILLPLEIYEIANRVTALKIIGFVINVAVVVYLLFAKRLFGLRGGGSAERELHEAEMSWAALERSTPGVGPEPPAPASTGGPSA